MKSSWCTAAIVAHLLVACGSAGPPPDAPTPRSQSVVCDDLCLRLTDCARADAMARAPETLATRDGVSGEQLLERNHADCVAQCTGGVMSARQQRGLEACFPVEACEPFVDCVDPLL